MYLIGKTNMSVTFGVCFGEKKTCSCSSMKVDGKAGSLSSSISRTHKLGNIDLQDHFQVAILPFSLHTQTSNVSF